MSQLKQLFELNKYFIPQTGINEINQVKLSGAIQIKINIPQTPLHILTVHTIFKYIRV